jgi:hypothetical protein
MLRLLMTLVLVATVGYGQAPSSVQPYHKAGDTLRYTLVFDGDPNFSSVTLFFSTSAAPADQSGLSQSFGINKTQRLGPGKFEVEGTIPGSVVSGSYILADIQPRIDPNGVRDYDARAFHQGFEVENPVRYQFPPLKDVSPN